MQISTILVVFRLETLTFSTHPQMCMLFLCVLKVVENRGKVAIEIGSLNFLFIDGNVYIDNLKFRVTIERLFRIFSQR